MGESSSIAARKSPVGPEVSSEGVHFRVWAPERKSVRVVLEAGERTGGDQKTIALEAEGNGYFSALVPAAGPGSLYWYQVDQGTRNYPDPASRFMPEGVHGPSEVTDLAAFPWQDQNWPGVELTGQVLYEMHVGAFTPEGTWEAAAQKLPYLAEVGITLLEIMPVAEFPGEFGWGYDGVQWFAPTRLYGRPEDFCRFVDAAHEIGIGVILDVVYNHFGPTGNYTGVFSPYYPSKRHPTEWGEAINFDGQQAGPVRDYVTSNVAYWIRDFHLDGLRLDATQAIYDDSKSHILAAIGTSAREAAGERSILIFAENESQLVRHVEPVDGGGYALDGLWNDDFHHSCRVAATGHAEFYYNDFTGSPQEMLSALRHGYLYQGQWNPRQETFRGTPARHIAAPHFVHFLQNHDQVANSARGLRLHAITSPGRFRALTALLLLGPQTPLLFMGQEFAASTPFLYFADHEVDTAKLVREGRWEFMRRFPSAAGYSQAKGLADPSSRKTFEASKLNWTECDDCDEKRQTLLLHRELLQLRRDDPVFSRQDKQMLEGAVIGAEACLLRWFDEQGDDRLLLINLGRDFHFRPVAEPLIAAPLGCEWKLKWSSEAPRYGGSGTAMLNTKDWYLPGHAAILLSPAPRPNAERQAQ